jgi:hypothetical protein
MPKSATTASLASRVSIRKITPGRKLLGPIHPPLPHSQSTNNISDHAAESELSIHEAIRDSRMTQEEIQLLNQVQKEAVQNQTRLRAKYGTSPLSPRSPLSEIDNLSTRRKYNAALKVDTKLANAAADSSIGSSICNISNDGTVEKEVINPKHVRILA